MQPEPSLVLSQLVQRHAGPSLPLARQPSPPTQRLQQAAPAAPSPGLQAGQGGPLLAAGSAKSPAPSAGLDPPGSGTPHQQQRAQLKGQKRRIPPTSKVLLDPPPKDTAQTLLRKHAMQRLVCKMPDVVPDFHFVMEGYRTSSGQQAVPLNKLKAITLNVFTVLLKSVVDVQLFGQTNPLHRAPHFQHLR